MARSRISSLLLALLATLLCLINKIDALPRDALSLDPASNTTNALTKRGCRFNPTNGQWDCDTSIPKISELIAQMRDEPGGLATTNRVLVFYTNLNDPALLPGKDPSLSWVVGWLDANGFKEKYFWWGRCVNQYCKFPPSQLSSSREDRFYIAD